HWELFSGYGQLPEFVTAIVGNTSAGKSHFFTVMVFNELMNQAAVSFVPESEGLWLSEYYGPLYESHMAIRPTAVAVKQKYRIIYRLSIGKRRFFNVFFDIAGETLANIGHRDETNETRYLWESSGIIFLINPRDVNVWAPYVEGGLLGGQPPDFILTRIE